MYRQRIHYVTAPDGARLAWAQAGTGPTLVKAANWLTHLEADWESPVWRHWMHFLAGHFRFVRYDERGCGLSEWKGELSLDAWVSDLEAVIDASGSTEPVMLLGISQGAATCIAYAARHPERVARLILYGGYALGVWKRGSPLSQREYAAMVDLTRSGWGRDNPTFRQVFTSRFVPDATPEQIQWWNELCRKTTTGDIAAQLFEARATVDVTAALPRVRTPTLVLHARRDEVISVRESRRLAAEIPGAEFVELDSRNHVLLEHEPAWTRFCDAVLNFTGRAAAGAEDPAFSELSQREREVLALLADGLSNAEIAERLSISEKTVRNHTSRVFDKLGVWTRAQAIVFARERGFSFSGAARKDSSSAP
jgi:pimeloyl-ACP methyl ester carboxylesterase/DNA-binding CsgD family transcriptional regulator